MIASAKQPFQAIPSLNSTSDGTNRRFRAHTAGLGHSPLLRDPIRCGYFLSSAARHFVSCRTDIGLLSQRYSGGGMKRRPLLSNSALVITVYKDKAFLWFDNGFSPPNLIFCLKIPVCRLHLHRFRACFRLFHARSGSSRFILSISPSFSSHSDHSPYATCGDCIFPQR